MGALSVPLRLFAYTTNLIAMETDTPTKPQAPSGSRQFLRGNEVRLLVSRANGPPSSPNPKLQGAGAHMLPSCSKWGPPCSQGTWQRGLLVEPPGW